MGGWARGGLRGPGPAVPGGAAAVELLIVRHARPEAESRPDGEGANPPLSDIGRRQAQVTADLLAGEGIEHVVTSTMRQIGRASCRERV